MTEGSMEILLSAEISEVFTSLMEYGAGPANCQVDTSVFSVIHGNTPEDRRKSMEQRQIDRRSHAFVTGVPGVEMVAGIGSGIEDRGIGGIARDLIEVDDAVEDAAGADPLIDGFAHLFAGWRGVVGADIRSEGSAEDFDAVGMGARDKLGEGGD